MNDKFKNRCWLLHSWSKWEMVKVPVVVLSTNQQGLKPYQRRVCSVCGKIEEVAM